MSRIKETTIYQFDELNDSAKDTARDWYRSVSEGDNYFAESVIENAAQLGAIIGIDICMHPVKLMNGGTRQEPNVYWSIGGRDEGASYEGRYSYRKHAVRDLEKEAPSVYNGTEQTGNAEINRICRALADVQRRNFYQVQAIITVGTIDVERADDKPMSDADVEQTREALRDFAEWIHRQLESEWEYQNSDECIDENIRANEYEFDEDGNRA